MKDNIFLDTNILVYLFDKSEVQKHAASRKLFRNLSTNSRKCISTQVVNEFIVIATKKIKNPISFDKMKRYIEFFSRTMSVFNLELATSFKAVALKSEYHFSYWDSLIIASALENDCTILYSEDMQHGQLIENRLKIINPFETEENAD